jgi:hypothetical protein
MTYKNTDFQNFASSIFLRADLEQAPALDSPKRISIFAHANLPGNAHASRFEAGKANGFCPPGKSLQQGDPVSLCPRPNSIIQQLSKTLRSRRQACR